MKRKKLNVRVMMIHVPFSVSRPGLVLSSIYSVL